MIFIFLYVDLSSVVVSQIYSVIDVNTSCASIFKCSPKRKRFVQTDRSEIGKSKRKKNL